MKPAERLIMTQFCDDVRQEVGNKYSLMGCYSQELIVENMPAALPKLCAHVLAFTAIDRPFANLVFRAYLNDQMVAELEIPKDALDAGAQRVAAIKTPLQARLMLNGVMVFSPLIITTESQLRVDAESEGEVIRGPALVLRSIEKG